jgi:hypothetical protein
VRVRGDDERGVNVMLEQGAVTCEVAPRRGRPPFVVDAGEVRVRVVGTRFTVTREGPGARVHVDHGAVEVTSHGAVVMLHDGESWPAARSTEAAAAPIAPPPDEIDDTPAPVASAPPLEVAPAPPRGAHRGKHGHAPAVAPPVATADAPARATPPAQAADTAGPSPDDLFDTATRLERARPDRAEAIYRQLANGTSPWAANALFALARLEADRGNRAAARDLLDRYLARYPRGTNAADARALRDRLQ